MSQDMDGGTLTLLILIGYFYWGFCRWMINPPPADRGPDEAGASGPALLVSRRAATARAGGEDAKPWARSLGPGSPEAEALWRVRRVDRSFDAARFMQGAMAAYEAVLTAFADGDVCVLAGLTAADVYDPFVAAIAERETQAERTEWALLSVDSATVADADVREDSVWITVRFSSRFATCRRNHAGDVVDGSEGLVDLTDDWTFARGLASRDPNWKLVATDSARA